MLKKRNYIPINIEGAVIQVLLDWDAEVFESSLAKLRVSFAEAGFVVRDIIGNHVEINFSDKSEQTHLTKITNQGILVVFDESTELICEPSGYRVIFRGAYTGRDVILGPEANFRKQILASNGDLGVRRVSVLMESCIVPSADPYSVEDYIVPKFNFHSEGLSDFISFLHDVHIDLSELAGERVRARVEISGGVKREGLSILIDVLDENRINLSDLDSRIRRVKDLESHVFESVITDRSRELYGEIEN